MRTSRDIGGARPIRPGARVRAGRSRAPFLLRALPWALLLAASSPAGAVDPAADSVSVLRAVEVEGHGLFSTREILETLALRPGERVRPVEVRDRLGSLLLRYRDSGRPRAEILATWTPDGEGGASLRLGIDEGPDDRVARVTLEGCGAVPCADLEPLLDTRAGGVLRSAVFDEDVERVLALYETRGYPYAAVEPRLAWEVPRGLSLALDIREGPLVTLGDIQVEGAVSTRPQVVERELGVRRGDVYDQRRIDRIRPRLLRLGFLEDAAATVTLEDRTGRGTLHVKVEERRSNSLYGAVGYVPGEGEGYLTGILEVSFGNIAGTGRKAAARWRTYRPQAFEWTFSYGEPWLLRIPVEGQIRLHQEVRDSTLTQTLMEAGVEYPLGDRFWGRLGGRTESATAGSGGQGGIRDSRRHSLELGLRWDGRDDPLNPSRGSRAEIGLSYGRKRYEGEESSVGSAITRARGDLFLPVTRGQVLALWSSAEWLATSEDDIPEHEQFRIGGAETLRGYVEDAYFGWRVWSGGLEYRYLLGRRSRVHLFVDAAHLDRKIPVEGGTEDRRASLLGYGVGLRTESRLGMVGVDFGLARGEPLTEGKLHLRVESEF